MGYREQKGGIAGNDTQSKPLTPYPLATPSRILFVCHGNICRSPMAQSILTHIVRERGWAENFVINSAGVTDEAVGCSVDNRTVEILTKNGVEVIPHTARKISPKEYTDWDKFILMDRQNMYYMKYIFPSDPENKIRLMLPIKDIVDPWYTGDFKRTFDEIVRGCNEFLADNYE
ncbi:MAG: low molecular weight phosphotyrosine protein phosphatase [Christensenellaceae bacterium]|jgi:protein-tyrosine phosphatase|nr:low molecular weight phosphotyrosine protein phosphatase [Christensenellaceae bacterium]